MITQVRCIATKEDGSAYYMLLDLVGRVSKAKAISTFKAALPKDIVVCREVELLYLPDAGPDK